MSTRHPGIRESGKGTWEIKYEAGLDPITRKRRTIYTTFKGTKAEASAERERLKLEARGAEDVSPSKLTTAQWIEQWDAAWLEPRVRVGKLGGKTAERYRQLLRLQVIPNIGATLVQRLRAADLEALYLKLEQGGLHPQTCLHVHRVIHRLLGEAVWQKKTRINVAATLPREKRPKAPGAEVEIVDKAQLPVLLRKLHGHALFPIAFTALGTGARRGELLALSWGHVDLAAGKIKIERAIEETKGGMKYKAPKTKHGRREIAIDQVVTEVLKAQHDELNRRRLGIPAAAGNVATLDPMPSDALVFPMPDGSIRSPNGLSRDWARTVKALALPAVSFHALRHTHASQLIEGGMNVVKVSRRLGHGSPQITLKVYAHLFDKELQAPGTMIGLPIPARGETGGN